jgi:hypothetical protein
VSWFRSLSTSVSWFDAFRNSERGCSCCFKWHPKLLELLICGQQRKCVPPVFCIRNVNNVAETAWGEGGAGAVWVEGGTPSFSNCTFSSNLALGASCWFGIESRTDSPTKHETGSSAGSGAVWIANGAPTFSNCLFSRNIATSTFPLYCFEKGRAQVR